MSFVKILVLTVLVVQSVSSVEIEDYISPLDENEPEKEVGMMYTVPQTVDQLRNFFSGLIIGFYHNPVAAVDQVCLNSKMLTKIEFLLAEIYMANNIFHFLDLWKITRESIKISRHINDKCGFQYMIKSMNHFCEVDHARCTFGQILTNLWWHTAIIGILAIRIIVNMIELIVWGAARDEDSQAEVKTENNLYDIGEDVGSIIKYTLDFHTMETIKNNEWDNMKPSSDRF